uniref:Uncharacterized protein n=1 Tax=Strongyloides papillosus TaxID=174720 RepID=A0A0N5B9H1_STREA
MSGEVRGRSKSKAKSLGTGNPLMVGGSCAFNVDFGDSIRNIFPFTNKYGSKQIEWFGFLSFPEVNTSISKQTDNKQLTRNAQLQVNYVQKSDKSYEYIPTNFICYFDMQRLFLSKGNFSNNTIFGLNGPPFKKNFTTTTEGGKKKFEYIKLNVILRFTPDGKYQLTDKIVTNKKNPNTNQATNDNDKDIELLCQKIQKTPEDSKKENKKEESFKERSINIPVSNSPYDPTKALEEDEEEYKSMKFHSNSGLPTVLLSPSLNNVTFEINDDKINYMNDESKSIFKYICEEYKKKYIVFGYVNTPMLDKLNFQRFDKNLLLLIPGFGRSTYCHALMKQRPMNSFAGTSKRRRRTRIDKASIKRKTRSPPAPSAK